MTDTPLSERTPEEIAACLSAMQERCDKAAPGPWLMHFGALILSFFRNSSLRFTQQYFNVEFIAAARTDLPLALDYIRVLEQRITEQNSHQAESDKRIEAQRKELTELQEQALRGQERRDFLHKFWLEEKAKAEVLEQRLAEIESRREWRCVRVKDCVVTTTDKRNAEGWAGRFPDIYRLEYRIVGEWKKHEVAERERRAEQPK